MSIHLINALVWTWVKKRLKNLERVKAVVQAPLQQMGRAELQSIEAQIETTKAEQACRLADMDELRGYARALVVKQLNVLEAQLEKLLQRRVQAVPRVKEIGRASCRERV